MKKNLIYILLMLPLLGLLSSCHEDDEIIFDHELPQFEIKTNAILLEFIVPQGTRADDNLYIVGEFNGGEELAVGDMNWQLEKSTGNDVKWGIYLYPSTFVSGKTLSDGFYLVSEQQGIERTVKNEDSTHSLDAAMGTRTNVWVNRWKAYFESGEGDDVKHDGYAIFVEDNTTWEALALYAWGDAELGGGWPGIQVTGIQVIGNVLYKYFDTGEAFKGLNINLIFNNNNNGKQLEGDGLNVTLDRDYYFRISDSGYEQIEPSDYNGFTIYVDDQSGWDDLAIYGWADGIGDVSPTWPGFTQTGARTINGIAYKTFELGEELTGATANLIFNNNNGGQQFDGPQVVFNQNFYYRITNNSFEVLDPNTATPTDPVDPSEPTDPTEPGESYTFYIDNQSGWDAVTIYGWGDIELGGGWPGLQASGTTTINGIECLYFELDGSYADKSINLIFNNNNGGLQFDGPNVVVNRNYYFRITDSSCEEFNPTPAAQARNIYVEDNTGWDALALYGWGDVELGGGWPGLQPSGQVTIDGKIFKQFIANENCDGKSVNLIFNNNNGGVQFDGPNVVLTRDYYFSITADTCTEL